MKYDVIIIGGGHNGLVAAAFLAKKKFKVCVIEKRGVLGGCCSTEELWPGFKVSPAAYVISLFSSKIIKSLNLKKYGFKILPRNPSSFTPLPNGKSLVLGHDEKENIEEIGSFSVKDAIRYKEYEGYLTDVAKVLEPLMEKSPPVLPSPWRKLSVKNKIRNIARLSRSARAVKKLASLDAIRLMNGSAMDLLDEWFESDVLKATLATDAVIGAHMSPSDAGSAYVLLHHVMGDAGGQRGVWGYVEGGMGGLADSLEKCCINYGVKFVKETEVRQIVVKNSKVEAVLTDNGYFATNVVASSVDANLTFNKLIDAPLPGGFFNAVNRIDYSSATAKVNLALSGPPEFTAAKNRDISCLNGTIHISPSVSYIEDAFEDSKQGKFSRKPVLEITIPSMVDKTIAPEGKHIMSIFVQYAPYKLSGGWTSKNRDALFNACIETVGSYVPNIKDLILHKQILTPVDLEKKYGLTGGNIFQGAMSANQIYCFRPVSGYCDYRTPIEGLYMCGAATHPGGGVTGLSGRNGAYSILEDY